MRQPGSQFSGDGIDLSWPIGGEREVLAVPDEDMTLRIRRRIAEGQIVITDDKPTGTADSGAREYKLLTGEEARKRMAEPAGPVTRVVYHPATPEDEKYWNPEVQSVQPDQATVAEQQAERQRVAEEKSAAITKAQVEAERAAAEAQAAEAPVDEAPDARMERTMEAAADYMAKRDAAFMERETERQKQEAPDPVAKPEAEASAPKAEAKTAPAKAAPVKKAPTVKKPTAPRAANKG